MGSRCGNCLRLGATPANPARVLLLPALAGRQRTEAVLSGTAREFHGAGTVLTYIRNGKSARAVEIMPSPRRPGFSLDSQSTEHMCARKRRLHDSHTHASTSSSTVAPRCCPSGNQTASRRKETDGPQGTDDFLAATARSPVAGNCPRLSCVGSIRHVGSDCSSALLLMSCLARLQPQGETVRGHTPTHQRLQ